MQKLLLFVLIMGCFNGCGNESPKSPTPQQSVPKIEASPVPIFDGNKAFEFLTAQTDFGPRYPNSVGHLNCLKYLEAEMLKLAETTDLQSFTETGYNNETLKMTNLISSFSSHVTDRILLIAHWDTRPRADQETNPTKKTQPILGANDGASGVAILMEIARQLKSSPPSVGVDMLLVDGEDYGKEGDLKYYFLGAKYFASHLPAGYFPSFGILLDMVGDKQLEIPKDKLSLRYAPDIVNLVWSTANEMNIPQFINQTYVGEIQDDHVPLNEVGIKTVDLIDFNYPDSSNRYWHTTQDTPDKCSPESLEAVGKVLMHIIYRYQM